MSESAPTKGWAGDYLLIASGQTSNAPYLADWRKFKDHMRNYVKEQPGWVEVYPGRNRGVKESWSRLKDQGDAESAWSMEIAFWHV